jgi:alcohol dehydrogenase
MTPFDFRPRTRVVFGAGEFARLGEVARELGATKCLLVADPGMVEAGYAQEAIRSLKARRMEVFAFHDFAPNPTTAMVEAGASFAAPHDVNLIVALGGGSSMDCAKAINFLVSNGGSLAHYRGYGKATKPMLAMIAVPTTAGTGSEAQSFATLTDVETRRSATYGDAKLWFRTAVLDPKLTATQTAALTASAGYDAISHALESLVSTRRTALSDCFARAAWRLLHSGFERVVEDGGDLEARGAMLLGAHFAGMAVEHSMLGAAHACAHALTAGAGIPHGVAIAAVLRWVVEWNSEVSGDGYREIFSGDLVHRLGQLSEKGGLPLSLRDAGVARESLPRLADDAGSQWPGRFNPRPFDAAAALEILERAY